MSITFATVNDAFFADLLPPLLYVRIGGEVVAATEASTHHSVERSTGTATALCEAPGPAGLDLNAEIEIEMGYPGASRRVFHGTVESFETSMDGNGRYIRINGRGWSYLLSYPEAGGIEIPGPISLKDVFRALCQLRNVPTYLADDTTAVDGVTTIMLGGNPDVNGGNIRIDDETTPLEWLQNNCEAYGYRVFDAPDGTFRLARVSGLARPEFTGQTLTTDLQLGDYLSPRGTVNFRTGPSTSYSVITTLDSSLIGRVVSDEQVSANGFRWMRMTFTGLPAGWCAIHSGGTPIPNFWKLLADQVPVRFGEGDNTFSSGHSVELRGMETYIEVIGVSYTAPDGGPLEIRAIPDVVPYDRRLAPLGYVKGSVDLQDIVTDQQAQWARNATEVDRAAPYELVSWEFAGRADLQPGDVVTFNAPLTHGLTEEDHWLIDVDQSVSGQGYRGRYSGWRGGGTALKAGNDCVTVPLGGDSVIHAGTQTLSYYRDPSPDSVRDPYETDKDRKDRRWIVERPFTVDDADYSSVRLAGKCHGTNSIKNRTSITGSAIEIWQLQDPSLPQSSTNELKRVGSVELPTCDEELSRRRNYAATDRYWQDFVLPLPGTLKVGAAKLLIVCGESDDGEVDDFELTDLVFKWCGVGEPIFAGSVSA